MSISDHIIEKYVCISCLQDWLRSAENYIYSTPADSNRGCHRALSQPLSRQNVS